MKALVYVARNKVEMQDIPEPKIDISDGIKVRIDYCAMCATDVHIVTMGLYNMPPPWVMGHEVTGTITELAAEAEKAGYKIGDKVVVNLSAPCGICEECKRGNDIWCTNAYAAKGGFTEYIITKPRSVFKIPENSGIDQMYYALAEPMASAMDGIDLAQIKIGSTVAISGVGGIGSIILNMLLLRGGARVTAIDPVAEKRELALKMGAQYAIDPYKENLADRVMEITGGRGFDVIFDAAGVPKAAPPLLKLIAHKGTMVYFAVFPMDYELPVNLYDLYYKEGRIQTVFTTIYNYPRVIDLIPRMQLDKIVTKVLPLSQGVEAFNLFLESKNNKIIVKCSDYQ
jgi:(R,R)-butanediol dehydrogenase/meso-butanediol dehydrogenase/diacetyl reductase